MVSLPRSAFANLNSADLRSTRRFSEFANGIVLWRLPILEIANQHDLVPARRIGVDASTQQANASLRPLVRRDTGEDYQEMLRRLARASGIETPTTAELIRFDRARKNKTLSNADWRSETDPAARIAKMKDGRTRLGYKPEHAVDLDSEVIVA
jgi:hypothetical protein